MNLSLAPLAHDESLVQPPAIQAELVDMFHRRAPAALIALNILFAVLLVGLLWGRVDTAVLLSWSGAATVVALANMLRHRRYEAELRRAQSSAAHWRRSFIQGTVANGAVWGAAGVVLYTEQAPVHSAFVLLLICGITAGVAASQSSMWRAVQWFAMLALLPPAVAIALMGGSLQAVVSILLVCYFIYILVVGHMNHRSMVDAIRLRFDNDQLLGELRQREQDLRALIDNTPDMVAAIGLDGTIRLHSASSKAILGYDADQLTGHSVLEFIHPDDRAVTADELIRGAAHPGTHVQAEIRWRHQNGEWRLLECIGSRMGGGRPVTVVVNARDITDRRAMEDELRRARDDAEQASRIKSQFLATMSHEIRTPMHSILGMADLLQQTRLSHAQQGYVETFQAAGRHLLALIDDILDFSRLEAGGLQLADLPFDLGELLAEVADLLGAAADAKGLHLRMEVATGLPLWRRGDPQRLRQIIVNLVNNAIKFTDRGSIDLVVTPAHGTPAFVDVAVTDTGIGIPADRLATLFAPFTQVNAGHTRDYGGTGLGLSICQRLVRAMGGSIEVRSTSGQGSTFHFTVALPVANTAPDAEPALLTTVDPSTLPAAQLLVADDSAMNRLVVQEFLRDTPCHLTYAHNGVEAVTLFSQHHYDMILMDIQMPLLDGWSATRQIRQFERDHSRPAVPIIALTASAMEEDRSASLAAGCTTFAAKPLSKAQLLTLLQRYLHGERATAEAR